MVCIARLLHCAQLNSMALLARQLYVLDDLQIDRDLSQMYANWFFIMATTTVMMKAMWVVVIFSFMGVCVCS